MDTALSLLIALLNQASTISLLITNLRAEGRDTLNADEWAMILDRDDVARAAQIAAIARHAPEA